MSQIPQPDIGSRSPAYQALIIGWTEALRDEGYIDFTHYQGVTLRIKPINVSATLADAIVDVDALKQYPNFVESIDGLSQFLEVLQKPEFTKASLVLTISHDGRMGFRLANTQGDPTREE